MRMLIRCNVRHLIIFGQSSLLFSIFWVGILCLCVYVGVHMLAHTYKNHMSLCTVVRVFESKFLTPSLFNCG